MDADEGWLVCSAISTMLSGAIAEKAARRQDGMRVIVRANGRPLHSLRANVINGALVIEGDTDPSHPSAEETAARVHGAW